MDATEWYQNLNKPGWAPDESVFSQVWRVLYPIIIVVNIYILVRVVSKKLSPSVALPFWLNLVFNLAYSPIQFGLRNDILALVDIVLVLGSLVWAMIAIWPHHKWVAILYVPYLVWVGIATVLQLSITWLNR